MTTFTTPSGKSYEVEGLKWQRVAPMSGVATCTGFERIVVCGIIECHELTDLMDILSNAEIVQVYMQLERLATAAMEDEERERMIERRVAL